MGGDFSLLFFFFFGGGASWLKVVESVREVVLKCVNTSMYVFVVVGVWLPRRWWLPSVRRSTPSKGWWASGRAGRWVGWGNLGTRSPLSVFVTHSRVNVESRTL